MKCAARGSLKMQDAKINQKSPSAHHRTTLSGYIFATLRPSLAFSYIGSVTARHSSSGRQPNFAAWYKE